MFMVFSVYAGKQVAPF